MEASKGISSSGVPRPVDARSGASLPPLEREASRQGHAAAAADRFERPTADFVKSAVDRLRAAADARLESVRARARDGSIASAGDPSGAAAAAAEIVEDCSHR